MADSNRGRKKFRLQGLSFREELDGEVIDFQSKTIYLSLIPWESCPYSCLYCHEGDRRRGSQELSLDDMLRLIDEAAVLGVRSLLLLGGEVLLRSKWEVVCQVVQAAADRGLITVIYTNGCELNGDMAKWLADRSVSLAFKMDSIDEQKYDAFTRSKGSFARTMKAIDLVSQTSIGDIVCENERERLVRLLFTTVGCSLNIDEYISLARFATNHGARWMMESLNHRGDVADNPQLAIGEDAHSAAMRIAIALNPQQEHTFHLPCRLLSCVTVRRNGEVSSCPQDYCFAANIRECGGLATAARLVRERIRQGGSYETWTGKCPIKQTELAYA